MAPRVESAPVPRTDAGTLPSLVAHLRAAFDAGRTRPLEWRRSQLHALVHLLSRHGNELADALNRDLGKPPLEAWATDLQIVKSEAEAAAKQLASWTRPERRRTPLSQQPGSSRILREPLGVVLIIAPWNYPVQLLLQPAIGAIAAGNAMVLKPSEVTPHVSEMLARRVREHLDSDAIAIVEGGVTETTALLAERFDHVFYTGNGTVGRVVMEAAAKHLTPVTLELGGKSPCIVDASADIPVAARRIAWGKFLNAGQTCIAPDYVLAHESVEEELLAQLRKTLREFYGDDPRRSRDYGRIVNERHHRRLAALLKSGEVVVGGDTDESERYIAPTILRNVAEDSPVMADEIFGPILPVLRVRTIDDAVAFVNRRPKPLALYVFTRSPKVEEAVLRRTSSGGACVNATLWHIANPELPFGGVGPSGIGAYHGRASFELFSHHKSVLRKPTLLDPKIAYPPYSRLKTELVKRFL